MAWFKRMVAPSVRGDAKKVSVPTGLWKKCDGCSAVCLAEEFSELLEICPKCGHHDRIGARARIESFLDEDSIEELAEELSPSDPLSFSDNKPYLSRVAETQAKTKEREAFVLVTGRLQGRPVVAGAFAFAFMGGSMGSVVGEKVTMAFELATQRGCPVILFHASGGARMQEGILSLMQMAKTSAAIGRFRSVRQPYVSVLTDPTTGGVAASFAMLGDVIVAEPNALVGFAGPRVIEQTIRQKLPEGFQRSEFLLEHGVIDMIVPRRELRSKIATLIRLMAS